MRPQSSCLQSACSISLARKQTKVKAYLRRARTHYKRCCASAARISVNRFSKLVSRPSRLPRLALSASNQSSHLCSASYTPLWARPKQFIPSRLLVRRCTWPLRWRSQAVRRLCHRRRRLTSIARPGSPALNTSWSSEISPCLNTMVRENSSKIARKSISSQVTCTRTSPQLNKRVWPSRSEFINFKNN